MTALRDGIRRVNDAPAILIGAWLLMLGASVPLALAARGMMPQRADGGTTGAAAADGGSASWTQEFSDHATGVGVRITPTLFGFDSVLDKLDTLVDDERHPLGVVGASYIVAWLFLAGGIIDRYARDRPTRAHGFFAVSGVFFFRFLRLAVVMAIVYGIVFSYLRPWLFDDLYARLIRGAVAGDAARVTRIALAVVFGAVLAACNLIFDYTQVRAVVEDRRSMLGSIAAAVRFAGAHPLAVISLYAADLLLLVGVIVLYTNVAAGAGGAGRSAWPFVLGQLYALARVWVKLVFWASETALFQSRLAHAGYVARAAPVWPESPAAEQITNSPR